MPLTWPDNPLVFHYFCFYLKWVYDNEMFTTGDTLNCSYGGLEEDISDFHSLRAYGCFTRLPVSGHRLGLLYVMIFIPIHSEQTSNDLRLQPLNPTQHWSHWRPWGYLTPSSGVPGGRSALTCLGSGPRNIVTPQPAQGSSSPGVPGGRYASTCLGIQSLGDCHASACLGIFTLTRGHLALRLQQYWVG